MVDSVSNTVAVLKPAVYNRESWLWQPGDWASFWSPDQETLSGMARVIGVRDLETGINNDVQFSAGQWLRNYFKRYKVGASRPRLSSVDWKSALWET